MKVISQKVCYSYDVMPLFDSQMSLIQFGNYETAVLVQLQLSSSRWRQSTTKQATLRQLVGASSNSYFIRL